MGHHPAFRQWLEGSIMPFSDVVINESSQSCSWVSSLNFQFSCAIISYLILVLTATFGINFLDDVTIISGLLSSLCS